ncbi:putative conjugal transfer protein TrbL [Acidiphilium multivorum AIU301]|uniref:Putative conjugal transfer protein TrbL n=1 Tax=Acidiphilium multivorum (strain DSM 11245 / JCM 8867 / NBRC 100883 / AIU 301) TaxID=926570 RepID=F0J2K0_ACIMA|nr:P-type conjugative transfer protein TrbL [Acidiphilium multivorum]BAJ81944.1 putative conjugal transfer protein TrbL [Acidiphilium multivorum AIU301]GAN74228.1 conjugal transfer protein TrbL [Acidiphilium multivorum AIU301]
MGSNPSIIDHFLNVFSQYINSGFGLISPDVGFLVVVLIGIDATLAGLAWALGEDNVIQAFAKKVLYVGFFAFILNNWQLLAEIVFNSFAGLGLKATGSSLTYAQFLHPGLLAQAGVQGADVLLSQIQRLAGFPNIFWNLGEILVMGLSWIVTLLGFFVLAILLFLAIIEFKLTTLKGFILVPFALWRGTAFIAEPVLGQIVTSGVRVLVFAVVTGIGTQLFSQILPSNPSAVLSLQDALTILLASMTIAGLAFSANRLAAGITSGAPQLGLGSTAAAGGAAAGVVTLAGTGGIAAARAAASGVGAGTSLAGGASGAYAAGSVAGGGSVSAGLGGVARGAAGAAGSGLRGIALNATSGLRDRFAAGQRAGWAATGGSGSGAGGSGGGDSGGGAESASVPPGTTGTPARSGAPAWAENLRRRQAYRTAEQIIREGEAGGGGMRPNLRGDRT